MLSIHPVRRDGLRPGVRRKGRPRLAALLAAAVLAACSVEPQPVHLGSEECGHCRMVIGERQFASQALNRHGKAFKFDAVECLAEWVLAGEAVPAADLHSLWVTDFSEPESWVRVEDASFLQSEALRSPMGRGLAAFASVQSAGEYRKELGGELLTWEQVLQAVKRESRDAGHHHSHPH